MQAKLFFTRSRALQVRRRVLFPAMISLFFLTTAASASLWPLKAPIKSSKQQLPSHGNTQTPGRLNLLLRRSAGLSNAEHAAIFSSSNVNLHMNLSVLKGCQGTWTSASPPRTAFVKWRCRSIATHLKSTKALVYEASGDRAPTAYLADPVRILAAIAFTLCELATARGHSPPLECTAFVKASSHNAASTGKQYACVESVLSTGSRTLP